MPARRFDARRARAVRRAIDRTQSVLAKTLGVADVTVASWETGQSEPDKERLCAYAQALDKDPDELFPREGPPDLADLRCDAGHFQYETAALIGTKSAGPVANAERGKRRLSEGFVRPLAEAYGVSTDALLAAQERSFGNDVPDPENSAGEVPLSLADKINHLLARMYPGEQAAPSDTEIAQAINRHAGGHVISEQGVRELRTGAVETASPVVREGLAELLGVSPIYFQPDETMARQVYESLRLLAAARRGAVVRVAARDLDAGGLSPEVLAYLNDVVQDLEKRDLPGTAGSGQ